MIKHKNPSDLYSIKKYLGFGKILKAASPPGNGPQHFQRRSSRAHFVVADRISILRSTHPSNGNPISKKSNRAFAK
jgi:hypothetical protein